MAPAMASRSLLALFAWGAWGACPPPMPPVNGGGAGLDGGTGLDGGVVGMPGGAGPPLVPKEDDPIYDVMARASATQALLSFCEQKGESLFVAAQLCSYTTAVVAGTKYTLTMSTSEEPGPVFEVVVYEPLPYTKKQPEVIKVRKVGG